MNLKMTIASFPMLLAALFCITGCAGKQTPRPDPKRFDAELAKFDQQDKATPFAPGGIVFTGSSSVRLWDTKAAFPDLPVLNRGFGGSVANDLVLHADQVALRYKPRVLVLYTGTNDLNAKLTVDEVMGDYTAFLNIVHKHLPDTVVIVNSLKVARSRITQMPDVARLNGMLQKWCAQRKWTRWIDDTSYLLDDKGQPIDSLFREDKLHLSAAGYARWNAIIGPVLRDEWAKANAKPQA